MISHIHTLKNHKENTDKFTEYKLKFSIFDLEN